MNNLNIKITQKKFNTLILITFNVIINDLLSVLQTNAKINPKAYNAINDGLKDIILICEKLLKVIMKETSKELKQTQKP